MSLLPQTTLHSDSEHLELCSGNLVNHRGATHEGRNTVFKYVCGITAILMQGTLELNFTPLEVIYIFIRDTVG
jgi:hypothetical protein